MLSRVPLAALVVAALSAGGAAVADDEHGTLNPDEMTLGRVMENIRRGQTDMATCASGYFITKSGRHGMARELFETCAEAGYTGAMTWMSQLDNNGLGVTTIPTPPPDGIGAPPRPATRWASSTTAST